jgi:hypothetical protein
MAELDESAEARAHALVTRILGLLQECRAILPELDAPTNKPETPGAQAERPSVPRAARRARGRPDANDE